MSNSIVVGATQGMTKGFGFSVRKIMTLLLSVSYATQGEADAARQHVVAALDTAVEITPYPA
jgi:hypothetical protein